MGMSVWMKQADTDGLDRPMIVFNPGSTPRSGVVECEGELCYVADVPALGASVVDRAQEPSVAPVRVEGEVLSNGIVEARIDPAGRITSFKRTEDGREACRRVADGASGGLNQLVLYEDRPRAWEAWDIDAEYVEKPEPVEGPAALALAGGDLRRWPARRRGCGRRG